ncbi:hypothetical protein RD792_007377 [Penstemon davidsonii]|uniref:Zinc finger PHD-type domain-containing protein n=1 Tax=Penstemon davidsonii TaxID=160366 RepID=A0ABR0D7N8_9LAMI|nr:hypothetical protein RD792_007377 [Penstemon davidsonii]
MASSDDEGEIVPSNVSEYEFTFGNDEPVSFAELPVEWNKGGTLQKVFLRGKTDNGLQKLYKQVIAWKFDLSCKKPEISVLSVEDYWIKLLKPRKAFEVIIRSILITVRFLHYVKWNPERPRKALWDHLSKTFSMFESRPSENDLVDHMSLIREAVERDTTLAKSKLLMTFLEEKPRKRKAFNEDLNPPFIVDDGAGDEDKKSDKIGKSDDSESDDEDDCFDYVCAICDNGGHIYLCEGRCMRSFHGTPEDGEESFCESLGFTQEEVEALRSADYYCKNCEHKQHQCFSCGELGSSDESSGAEVFRCVNGACGHFYHPDCVAKLLHPGDEAAAEEHRQKIAAGEQFACPVHRCHACKELLEMKSNSDQHIAICRRCPRAFHRKCLPRDIAFEEDVLEERATIQRAWPGLIPNRILIYCLKHKINPRIKTPARNHIKFPGPQLKNKQKLPIESSKKDLSKDRSYALEDTSWKISSSKPTKGVEKVSPITKQSDLSRKRVEKLRTQGFSKKQKVALSRSSVGNSNISSSAEGKISLGNKLYATFFSDSEPVKPSPRERVRSEPEKTQKVMPTTKRINNSVTLDADATERILTLMKGVSSSITLEDIKGKHNAPSTHAQSSKFAADNITLGKVEGSVRAVRAALKTLDNGGNVQDAKAVCGNDLLIQVMKWKEKLKVYLAPFLYGMRYTSFGRHFTKMDKLKEIADMLHWYIQDGDMNDFSFERRDWMRVRRDELPDGSQLIMGLNPPFGVNASLANKFINKALEFKPKLLILIVPRETQRLDEKEHSKYDLIWENDQMLMGKSFYLPGSVDVNDKQIEDWNVNAPVLYLWSNGDWTSKHKAIAEQHGHLPGAQKNYALEESHPVMHVSNNSENFHKLDEPFPIQVEDRHPGVQENQEHESMVIPSHQEGIPRDNSGTKMDSNHGQWNNHSEFSKNFGGKRKKKRKRNDKDMKDTSSGKRSMSVHPSPKVADGSSLDTHSSKHLERQSHVHDVRDEYHQFDSRNFPTHPSYSQTGDDENPVDDLVRKYSLDFKDPNPSLTSSQAYSPTHPDTGFMTSTDRSMGHPGERTHGNSYRPYTGEMDQRYGRDPTYQSHVNIIGREEPNSWSHRTDYLSSSSGPMYPSPYAQLNPAANTSVMQRYAPRLDELNYPPMNNTFSGPHVPDTRGIYHPPVPRPGSQVGSLGFAPGPYNPYAPHNSSGWLYD